MRSSYLQNNYGELFSALVRVHKPSLIVECGILDGYSLISLAFPSQPYGGKVVGYDLFDDYEFKHGKKEEIENLLDQHGIANVSLVKKDAFEAASLHSDESVDFLHIDIANDGDKLEQMFGVWDKKMKKGGLIVFEGGSHERDEVDWMVEYCKNPIRNFKSTVRDWYNYEYVTLLPFPSLTICRKGLK